MRIIIKITAIFIIVVYPTFCYSDVISSPDPLTYNGNVYFINPGIKLGLTLGNDNRIGMAIGIELSAGIFKSFGFAGIVFGTQWDNGINKIVSYLELEGGSAIGFAKGYEFSLENGLNARYRIFTGANVFGSYTMIMDKMSSEYKLKEIGLIFKSFELNRKIYD